MRKPKLVSLYSGAGGLDYGFEAAGFDTVAAVEMDADCCHTLRRNRTWPVIEGDIHQVTSQQILDAAGLTRHAVDILIGGPPCQPFSKAGYWASGDARRLDDPRANTLHAYMRCVEDLSPRVFLLENVHGINYSGKEEGFRLLEQLTHDINQRTGVKYILSWKVLNAANYGVPQLRTRFFLVGHRAGAPFKFPDATHSSPDDLRYGQAALFQVPYMTAWDAIGDLDQEPTEDLMMGGKWADLLPSIPEGENYLWHTNRKGGLPLFGWRTRYWSFLLKLAKRLPSWTVQAQPGPAIGPFHWKNRRLSTNELARIQTFPSGLVITGGRTSVQKQLGNAVPSLLAEVLARSIGDQLFGIPLSGSPKLALTPRRPVPEAEPVAPVPAAFLSLQGDHADHPGEGLGRGRRLHMPELSSSSGSGDESTTTSRPRSGSGRAGWLSSSRGPAGVLRRCSTGVTLS